MMKTKILFIKTIVALIVTSSCTEDKIIGEKAPLQNPNSSNVFFSNENPVNVVLEKTATEFSILIGRKNFENEQAVKIYLESPYDKSLFELPSSVVFSAGYDTASVIVKVKNLELMKSYHLVFKVEFDQTNPYTIQDEFSRYEFNLVQEDYVPYADGIYSSEFFEDSWEQILEYSPSTEVYRFSQPWGFIGYDVTFKWDGGSSVNMIGTVSGSGVVIKTGYVHSRYGMISAYYEECTYNSDTTTFNFPIDWRVSAGSFGSFPDSYTINSLY